MPDWRAITRSVAQRVGIDPDIFERQIDQESGFNPNAKSGAGAMGIAQIVPSAHPSVDPMDPYAALTYAATWMKSLLGQYGGDWAKALAAYNAGPKAVADYGGVPPFQETQDYVRIILGGLGPKKAEAAELTAPAPAGGPDVPDTRNPDVLNERMYWTVPGKVDKSGRELQFPSEEAAQATVGAGGILGTGIGAGPSQITQHIEVLMANGDVYTYRRAPGQDAAGWIQENVTTDTARAAQYKRENPNPAKPDKPTVIGGNSANERYIVRQMPDGSITREPNPNYTPPNTRTPAKPNNKQVVTRNGKSYIYDPDTNTFTPATGLPDEEKAQAKPTVHTIGGRIYTVDADGNVIKTADVRTPEEVTAAQQGVRKGALDIQKTERDLLPKQQQIIQGHYDTIQYVQGMLERGEIDPSQADAYVTASRAAAEAALQGTTPFDIQKQKQDAERERQKMGIDILNQRIATTGSIGSSLLSAASSLGSRAMLRPGQTSIGFNPLADTLSFMGQATQQAQADPITAALLQGAGPGGVPQGLPPGAPSGLTPVLPAGASMPGAAR